MTYFRCTDCEREGRGFEHRELVNERCKVHALRAIVNYSFVEITYTGSLSGVEHRMRGLLCYYSRNDTFSIMKFARRHDDFGRHSTTMEPWQLRGIRPVSDLEQAQSLPPGTPVTIEHFGRLYNARVLEAKKTRVLVRFRGATGKVYDRWKSGFAVQHVHLPSTTSTDTTTTSKGA